MWLGLLISLFPIFVDPTTAIIGAIIGYLSLWSVFWLFKLMTGKEGMGYGDFKLLAALGAFVAARQSFLQWFPPQEASCGRDLYGMIETFPLKRVIPMIFKGSGDCTKVDWTFLSLSIANWSFVCFTSIALLGLLLMIRQFKK